MRAESYKAFLSYSHSGDEPLAAALQTALQRIGKPWYRRQACKVFRDQTSLEAGPALWPALERRLASSEFLILIASPEAARSAWVRREIQWWLANRSSETLLFVLAGGEIVWDDVSKDFDWPRTTALPTELVGRFKSVPFYVDMRWARGIGHLTLEQVRFRSDALTLSAALHGVAKDEIESEEIRQHRRVRRVIWTAGTVMAALTIVSVYASARAWLESGRANENWRSSESRSLAARATGMMRPDDVHSIDDAVRIAVMAWRLSPTDEAESVLRQLATATSGLARVLGHHSGTVQAMAFSPDSSLFATIANDGSIQIWTGGTWTPRGALLVGAVHDAAVLRFSRNGAHLLALGKTRIEVWDLRRGRLDDVTSRALSAHLQAEKPVTGDISSDGRFVAIANRTDLAAWDAQAQQFVRAQSASAMTGALGVHFDAQDRLLVIDAGSANTREGLGGSALSAVSWDLRANHLRVLGTPAPGSGHGLAYANDAVFTPSGDRFSTSGDGVELMWEVDPARGIHVVGGLPCCEPQPDETGRSVFVKSGVGRGNEWQRWDVASRTVVAQGHLSAYSKMLWSADGQWRAEMTHESGVQIWNGSDAGPASVRKIEPECERRQDMTTCVARVCEKLKPALNDEQLRELFGIASFEVMYDSYRKALGGPMC